MGNRKKLLKFTRLISKKLPILADFLRWVKWQVLAKLKRKFVRVNSSRHGLHVDPYKLLWISPNLLKNTPANGVPGVEKPADVSGVVKKGDWDRKVIPVDGLEIIRGAKDRFEKGVAWEDTRYYKDHLNEVMKGTEWRGCRNKDDLDAYFTRFDNLYNTIEKHGFKAQHELGDGESENTSRIEHEITVHIDRDGRLLFCDGRHRLAIALILGIAKIPVKVCVRHANWVQFCDEVLALAESNGGKLYQPIMHPDLEHIPSAQSKDRYEIIKYHLPEDRGDLLDIGSNLGFFCDRFEGLGFKCNAVEASPEIAYFLKKIKIANGKEFRIIAQSIFDYKDQTQFDVVLALNIFHHFLKDKSRYDALVQLLQRLDIGMMIFEPHNKSEDQMVGAYRNYDQDEFVAFVLENSSLNSSKKIGTADDGRQLYKLWR